MGTIKNDYSVNNAVIERGAYEIEATTTPTDTIIETLLDIDDAILYEAARSDNSQYLLGLLRAHRIITYQRNVIEGHARGEQL